MPDLACDRTGFDEEDTLTSPEQSLQALEWFEALAEADTRERYRRLDGLQRDEPALAAAVRELFEADGEDGLDSPHELAGALLDSGSLGPKEGDRLGPFELVQILGEGGMGTVWEALRVEGGFEQRVAVKFLRRLGLDANAERRFAFERQVLGRLRHPFIARVLDAGRTDSGVPYLVMEHVDGVRIDEYCDQHRLSVRERVRLMIEICRAVAHAHRNLVVHRDLKPANILVTREGRPRLLDFGIAKLLAEEDDGVALTAEGLVPMTLEYASPEQVQGLPVTTASDVYSLGVVLYQLFTGRTPFGCSAKSRLELGLSVAREDPTSPSSALRPGSHEAVREVEHVARARGVANAGQLRRELRGDLDNVTLRALQRDPERRYASVDALADDLESWLRGFPVQARGDSLTYRTSKFLRRNWIVVSAACLVVLSLAVGLGVATWQAKEAREQRDRADDNAQRTELVNQFLVNLLAAPGGRWWRDLENMGPETRVIDVIDEAAARLEEDLVAAPLQRAALHQTLNDTYLALGRFDQAERQVRQALAIRRRELGTVHPAVAESTYYLGATLKAQRRWLPALETYRSAIEIERQLPEPTPNYPHALNEAADAAARTGQHDLADAIMEEALAMPGSLNPEMHALQLGRRAWCLAQAGKLDEARAHLAESDRRLEQAHLGEADFRRFSQSTRAAVFWLAGELEQATIFSADPFNSTAAFWRAQALFDLGRHDEARQLLRTETGEPRASEGVVLWARLSLVSGGGGDLCATRVEQALAFEESVSVGPTWYLAETRSALASCLLNRDQPGDRQRAGKLMASARMTLDALFDDRTPLHGRMEAAYRTDPQLSAEPRRPAEPRMPAEPRIE